MYSGERRTGNTVLGLLLLLLVVFKIGKYRRPFRAPAAETWSPVRRSTLGRLRGLGRQDGGGSH